MDFMFIIGEKLKEGYNYLYYNSLTFKVLKFTKELISEPMSTVFPDVPVSLLNTSEAANTLIVKIEGSYFIYVDSLRKVYKIGVLKLAPFTMGVMHVSEMNSYITYLGSYKPKTHSNIATRINVQGLGYSCFLPIASDVDISKETVYQDSFIVSEEYKEAMKLIPNDLLFRDLISFNKDNQARVYKTIKEQYGFPYSISEATPELISMYKKHTSNVVISDNDKKVAELINPFTYGVEIETSNGIVPFYTLLNTKFLFLRDGSLDGGYEFTSMPLKGESGLANIKAFTEKANEYNCNINQNCSLHIHLGGVDLDKENIVSLYKTVYQCQQELFDFVPSYKRSSKYFAKKNEFKDHCKPLKSLGLYYETDVETMYSSIYDFVTSKDNQEMMDSQKWNQFPRYHHLNLLNWFKNKSTIEFRLHEPTLNYQRIVSWLLIISAITKFSKKYSKEIIENKIKISLRDIMNDIYPAEYANYLNAYIKSRTLQFNDSYIVGQDEDYHFLSYDRNVFEKETFISLF